MVVCLACTPGASSAQQAVHDDVALFTQYMSAEWIGAIVYHGADPADDPRWHLSGARTREEYRRWCRHACGMACLQMVLDHRDGQAPPLLELVHGCRTYGGYVEDDSGQIKGLYYDPFAAYARAEHGLHADVHPHLAAAEIPQLLADGHLVIASVDKEIRRPDLPAPGRGGHLVLITGHDHGEFRLHNPSGHTADARQASLPVAVFASYFAGRGIAVRTH
ncbi:C39 family peptidase [Nonomuraea sp. NPDC049400]|uniref:C39 family peptidase n=1 Tax=Nonomuraea sp. NPDC049400 TaxID=3364352 RepID=UPI0037A39108